MISSTSIGRNANCVPLQAVAAQMGLAEHAESVCKVQEPNYPGCFVQFDAAMEERAKAAEAEGKRLCYVGLVDVAASKCSVALKVYLVQACSLNELPHAVSGR